MNDTLITIFTEYIQSHLNKGEFLSYGTPPDIRYFKLPVEPIICNDGTRLSVQASKYHHCMPMSDNGPWTHVEVMVTNSTPIFFEDEGVGVCSYVPIELVAKEMLLRNRKRLT